jgi:RNA polymerase sigma-70 factor (ECF subfamily)
MGFPTTRWSLIAASGDATAARVAWNELAERYRAPIHAWFRCRYGVDRADDLTGSFFVESIAGEWWARADIERGNFRTYLRTLLSRFGARHCKTFAPQDVSPEALERLADAGENPEEAYDREFAHALVEHALVRLRSETANEAERVLLPFLLERGDAGNLKRLASSFGLLHNTLLQRLRRMRLRFRELLREEFAQLVVDPESIDAELEAMRKALSHAAD